MSAGDHESKYLDRLRRLPRPLRFLRARIRLLTSIAAGIVTLILLPAEWRWATRALIGWNVTVALYLTFAYTTMWRTRPAAIRSHAIALDDGRFAILILTAGAALASLAAIVTEISVSNRETFSVTLAIVTIVLSWAMVHTTFALHYAHDYYRPHEPGGLRFPDEDKPDYWDFVYFSFVIGMTAQVSDVAITDRGIRRTATAHGIVSFIFNTALLALTVNIAATAL
jgi:uncharacterized membrane protein